MRKRFKLRLMFWTQEGFVEKQRNPPFKEHFFEGEKFKLSVDKKTLQK